MHEEGAAADGEEHRGLAGVEEGVAEEGGGGGEGEGEAGGVGAGEDGGEGGAGGAEDEAAEARVQAVSADDGVGFVLGAVGEEEREGPRGGVVGVDVDELFAGVEPLARDGLQQFGEPAGPLDADVAGELVDERSLLRSDRLCTIELAGM